MTVQPPGEPNEEERQEEEPNDFDTPFASPEEARVDIEDAEGSHNRRASLGSTHPATDTNIELEEWYDEGLSGAAEASEPNANDKVIRYHKRRKPKK
jgi:hypothetical protein